MGAACCQRHFHCFGSKSPIQGQCPSLQGLVLESREDRREKGAETEAPNAGVAQGRGRREQSEDRATVLASGICHPLAGFILEKPLGNELFLHIPALSGSGISQELPGCFTTY